jgi:alpha-glucosidase
MSSKFKSVRSQSLGKLQSWKREATGITGSTDNGQFRLQFYSDSIVRISITRDNSFDDFSYSVVVEPKDILFQLNESENEILISTRSFKTKLTKDQVRFTFLDLNGKIINEDDPAFGTSWNGDQVTTYKKLQPQERFVGLGEKTGPLDRKGAGYQNWTTDAFAYSPGADPLYCSTPFYIGIHGGLVYGIFLDNSYKTFFNFGASNDRFASFAADAGEMNYYFMYGAAVADVIADYTLLTGRMEMPPLWSIGYQQCRYSYYPDKEVITLAKTFREKDIPADTIVLDIHYMESYKIFTWSKRDFPDPKALIDELTALGFHVVIMCDPGIKVEDGYHTYEEGKKQDVFIKYPDGTNYSGQVWPGWCHFPDFTNPVTRKWWQDQFKDYVALGIDGYWNDMNEIASWGNMLPEHIEFSFEGNMATARRGRNLFGFQMARATYEGTKALLNGKRPFNLTRSGFSGVQRYGAVWTGDNVAYDEHMLLGVRLVNSMGLTGISFAGYDIGGFVGEASTKLFARWISIATFAPFFRGHTMINSRDAEPWSFGEEVEQISRNFIKFRYQILPYVYSLFYESTVNGKPVQRSLAIDYTHDNKIYDGQFQNQYLFGPYFLVCPVESSKEFVKVYLPQGNWYSLYDGSKYSGNAEYIVECPIHKLPVFVREGAIIPIQNIKSNTAEQSDTLIVHIYSSDHNDSFDYFEDDGSTFAYQRDQFHLRTISYLPGEKKLMLRKATGSYQSTNKKVKIVFHGHTVPHTHLNVNDKSAEVHPEVNMYFKGYEKYDPFYDPTPASTENVHVVETAYIADEIVLSW